MSTSLIEINLATIDHNVRVIRSTIGVDCRLCAVIKADAYGLGAVRTGRHLAAGGIDMLAVYSLDQAAELLESAVAAPVLVLMPSEDLSLLRRPDGGAGLSPHLAGRRLHLAVHDERGIRRLAEIGVSSPAPLPVHLSIDTAMRCGGCAVEEVPRLLALIADSRALELAGIYTHFASANHDPLLTERQLRVYEHLVGDNAGLIPPSCVHHVANTYGTFGLPDSHRAMVRVGVGWAGYASELMRTGADRNADHLRPTVTWRSRLVHVKHVPTGSGLGYGQRWTARRDSVIGLVPVGYADGYPYGLGGIGSRARVAIVIPTSHGLERRFAAVVGAINMDQITVDLTDVVAEGPAPDRIAVGTEVELITPSRHAPNHLPRIAALAETLPHAVLCGLNPRIRRIYREPSAVVHTLPAAAAAVG